MIPEHGSVDDVPALVDLLEEAGAWLSARGIEQWPAGSNRAQEAMLRHQVAAGTVLVLRDGGRLAGGCVLSTEIDALWRRHPGRASYLHKLVVARYAAGAGLGAHLVRSAESWSRARSCEWLRLDCWDENDALRSYYRGLGFVELDPSESHGSVVRLFEKALGR